MFDWNDYSSDSAVPDTALLVSVRSQQMVLSAMSFMRDRAAWLEVDDTTWDEIDDAIGQAHFEIEESIIPMASGKAATLERTTTSFNLTNGAWQLIPMSIANNDDGLITFQGGDFDVNEAGLYRATLHLSVRNAATAASTKMCRLRNTTQSVDAIIGIPTSIAASGIVRNWLAIDGIFQANEGDNLDFQLYSQTSDATVEQSGTVGGLQSRCLIAIIERLHD